PTPAHNPQPTSRARDGDSNHRRARRSHASATTIDGTQNRYPREPQYTHSAGKNTTTPPATAAADRDITRRPMQRTNHAPSRTSAKWKVAKSDGRTPNTRTSGAWIHERGAPP